VLGLASILGKAQASAQACATSAAMAYRRRDVRRAMIAPVSLNRVVNNSQH